jgi:hypothetical protein
LRLAANVSFRFSLRSILLVVALAALGTAALVSSSLMWLGVISSLSVAFLLTSLTLATNTKGSARAFWIGAITWGVLYLIIVRLLWQGDTSSIPGRLITTDILRLVYSGIAKEILEPQGGGFPPRMTYVPYIETFLEIGHLLWSWVLALIGGIVGRATFIRFQVPIVRLSETSE